ncbi:hypothetical protein ACBP46_07110 [Paenalcaligenes hominis]|uniref:SecDF P1 head subdomain-containing protein n=1 Tax=Paenalcaligenes hominis TaxID=643674 RepID=UPI0035264B39
MPKLKFVSRLLAPVALLALAACQTPPTTPDTSAPVDGTAPATTPASPTDATQAPEAQMAAPLLVFLADTQPHSDWAEVQIDESNVLYLEPEAFLTRNDLDTVEAGTSETGEGLLALTLNTVAKERLARLTEQNPNKRLALVVDGTLLAIPGYSEPITEGRLIFMVGSRENAMMAARIIAGEDAQ